MMMMHNEMGEEEKLTDSWAWKGVFVRRDEVESCLDFSVLLRWLRE